jgi:endonuclease/exonuclease/phosphatase family metal-dependent hydrolase
MPQSSSTEAPSTLKRWFRRSAGAALILALVGAVVSVSVSYYLHGPSVYGPGSGSLQAAEPMFVRFSVSPSVEFTAMTLNAAHGRADGVHQALLSEQSITENLDQIASVLNDLSPEVVALQEADGPSLWSGRFDHVAYLADAGGYGHGHRGEHVSGLKLSYGTAVLSRYPMENKASITFPPSPPLFPKGFVVGEVSVPGVGPVTVASVHLDFARESVRQEQVERMVEELAERPRPLIVMGDFNCDWDDETTLPGLAEQLGLKVYEPEDTTTTFPKLGKRLDWIFVSEEFEFVDYQVNGAELSDHRAVVARLRVVGAHHGGA